MPKRGCECQPFKTQFQEISMSTCLRSIVMGLALATQPFAWAQDSVRASANASGASVAAVSVLPASVAVLSVYAGGVMVVESIRAIRSVVEVVFKGVGSASRAVVTLTAAAVSGAALAVGQSVKVVAEGSGYLLVAGDKVLCYVPGEGQKDMVRSERSK
jgi:hypothetical protein